MRKFFLEDVYVIASLLKCYIESLPEVLINKEQLPPKPSKTLKLDILNEYKNCILQLPEIHRYILKGLCCLFHEISNQASKDIVLYKLVDIWIIPLFKSKLLDYRIMKQHLLCLVQFSVDIFAEVNVPFPVKERIKLHLYHTKLKDKSLRTESEPSPLSSYPNKSQTKKSHTSNIK